jgi:PAS domain S-box-containing protein
MRIKNQFRISILIFILIFSIIAAAIFISQQQAVQISNQELITIDIQTRASNLAYISNDYFLFQQSSGLDQWQIEFSFLTSDISKLAISNPQQQVLLNSTKDDAQRLNSRWTDVVSYLENAPREVSIRVLPEFQTRSSRLSLQNQALIFDAQQLSQTFRVQIDQINLTRIILILTLLGLFGAYFITNYLLTYRKTLKAISELQNGIKIVGSGKLDYSLNENKNDEVGEISRSVNQMTANLKNVTASKTDLEQAQVSLRKSEQRWATTLASIGDAVIATDTTGKIAFMNDKAEELTGWNLSDASQKPVKEVFNIVNEQSRLEAENPVDRVLREGMVVGLANHTVLIQKNGDVVPIDDSGAPIKDKDGKTTGVVLIFRDITERKKAEEANAKQAELIDLSPDAIIVRKLNGTITFWNKGAEKLYGWTKDEAIGQDLNLLLKTEFPQSLEEIQNTLKMDGKWSGEIVHICKDGSKLVVQSYWLGKIGSDGKILEVLESNVDITYHIQMQFKLEESAIRLEEYANQMEELANQRATQLKDSERLAAIGATAGMVGHDIRNPLQAITSDVYLAKTELATIPEGEEKNNIQESLTEIEKNIEYINKIVADLQDFARPLNPHVEETDLKRVIDDLLTKNGLPKNINVSVKAETGKVIADSTFINRIMFNLVNNAIQAMPNGGKLTIHAYKKSNDVIIAVKDTGVGIPEAVKGKLFTPMFTTKAKGQGFGLAVIKRMTEALGGTVSFASQEGKGTTFIVRLPQKRNLK